MPHFAFGVAYFCVGLAYAILADPNPPWWFRVIGAVAAVLAIVLLVHLEGSRE